MKPGELLRGGGGGGEEDNVDKQMERQMGCMTGFFQIFDRHQILAGRRGIYAAKRLASFPSPVGSRRRLIRRSCGAVTRAAGLGGDPPRPSLPLPVFDVKDGRSSWKFREAPRLSLDSRVDVRGKLYPRERTPIRGNRADGSDASDTADNLRRSPSVVARLMGLDALPCNSGTGESVADADPEKKAELRRSASESRASKDVVQYQFVDGGYLPPPSPQPDVVFEDKLREVRRCIVREGNPEPRGAYSSPYQQPSCSPSNGFSVLQRKSFFDAQDYFLADPPKRPGGGGSLYYGEVEKRLRMPGMVEPVKNLETLKQVLEVIQLKGLLHSRQQQQRNRASEASRQQSGARFVYEHYPDQSDCYDSPIVLMKSAAKSPSLRPPPPPVYSPANESSSPSYRSSHLFPTETASRSPRRNRIQTDRAPARNSNEARTRRPGAPDSASARSPVLPSRRRLPEPPAEVATTTRGQLNTDRRSPSSHSPRSGSPRKAGAEISSRSPRSNIGTTPPATAARERIPRRSDDEFIVSGGCPKCLRVKAEYRDGKILLERCDKLLHSIAEITSKAGVDYDAEQFSAGEQQPSPVSVLDAGASFDRDDAGTASPSSLPKLCINFKASSGMPAEGLIPAAIDGSSEVDDDDFSYVSEILRASDAHPPGGVDFFQRQKAAAGDETTTATGLKPSPLHQRLLFDAVLEIVERRRQILPWEAFRCSRSPVASAQGRRLLPAEVWAELRKMQDHAPADDLCELICRVLRKDLEEPSAVDRPWANRPAEMSDAVLDIERLIYKDLVADAIRDLATFHERRRRSGLTSPAAPRRRRLLF
ncbi:unnamed protein product [Spirodela intermedia]|uniref:Uncharacterized protein n=1 Tax=Spirodela intermedia TaxID=51605 RepID=A0A7I8I7V6_SPIIN|nr:unnamed protein product [Spirodela intermedia]CAA6653726.1 unnamed protein product [Spirodela intermedia]